MSAHKLPIGPTEEIVLDEVEQILKGSDTHNRHQKTIDFISKRTSILESKAKIVELSFLTTSLYKGFIHPETRIFANLLYSPFLANDDYLYQLLFENLHQFINHDNWKTRSIREILPAALMLTLDHYFGNNWLDDTEKERELFYRHHTASTGIPIDLHLFKQKRIAACVEKAAVAQNLLSFLGYGTTIFFSTRCQLESGDMEPHAYNLVHIHTGRYVLFDPTNPIIVFDERDNLYSILPSFYPVLAEDVKVLQKGGKVEVRHQNFYQQQNGYVQKELKYRTYAG